MSLTSGEKTQLRADGHKTNFYLSVSQPDILFTAIINDAGIERGETVITYTNGHTPTFGTPDTTRIVEGITLAVVTDWGVQSIRITEFTSSPLGFGQYNGTITVDNNGIAWSNSDILTLYDAYDPRAIPMTFDSATGISTKRSQTYNDQGQYPPPLARPGPHKHAWLSGSTVTLNLNGDAEPIAVDSAISTWAWDSTGGTIDDDTAQNTTIEFDATGQYWVGLTVTDDNSKEHRGLRRYWIHSTDPSDADYPYTDLLISPITYSSEGIAKLSITVYGVADDSVFLDGTLVMLWTENWYGSEQVNIGGVTGAEDVLFTGYILKGTISKDPIYGTVSFEAGTITEVMKVIPMQALSIHAERTLQYWFQVDRRLNMTRLLHWLVYWHSNAMELADWFFPDNDDIYKKLFKFNDGNLYSQCREILAKLFDGKIGINTAGQIICEENINFLTETARDAIETESEITSADWRQQIQIQERHRNQISAVYLSGFYYDSGNEITPYCSVAPSRTRENLGGKPASYDGLILADQEQANHLAGRYLAVANLPVYEVRVAFAGNYKVVECFPQKWWTMSLAADDTIRGLVWTDQKLIPRQVTYTPDTFNGLLAVDVIFEPEADGPDGIYDLCPSAGTTADGDGATGPQWPGGGDWGGSDLEKGVLAFGSMFYRSENDSTWSDKLTGVVIDPTLQHGALDPYWINKALKPSEATVYLAHSNELGYWNGSSEIYIGPITTPSDPWGDGGVDLESLELVQVLPSTESSTRLSILVQWQYGGAWRGAWAKTEDGAQTWAWKTLENGTGQEVKPIWLAEAQQSGAYFYSVSWLNGYLELQKWNQAGMSQVGTWTLGSDAVSETQLDEREYYAFPVTHFSDDNLVWVAGRFPGVPSDANLKHIVKFDGSTWTTIIDDWEIDHCGALIFKQIAGVNYMHATRQNLA